MERGILNSSNCVNEYVQLSRACKSRDVDLNEYTFNQSPRPRNYNSIHASGQPLRETDRKMQYGIRIPGVNMLRLNNISNQFRSNNI
jgi:hypothetical protein